jgi:hypothetical protein
MGHSTVVLEAAARVGGRIRSMLTPADADALALAKSLRISDSTLREVSNQPANSVLANAFDVREDVLVRHGHCRSAQTLQQSV